MLNKQITAKRAWADLSERARLGYTFGFISCLGLLYKTGGISREEVLHQMLDNGITREDCIKFRTHFRTAPLSNELIRG